MHIDSKYFQAWLGFLIVHSFGAAFGASLNIKNAMFLKPTDAFSRRTFAFLMILAALIRIFLLKEFDNTSMHWLNILTSACVSIFYLLEMFYFGYFLQSPATALCCTLNGFTVIIFIIYIYFCRESAQKKLEEKENVRRKGGRLFARHYMEGNILNPPDTEEIRELRRRAQ